MAEHAPPRAWVSVTADRQLAVLPSAPQELVCNSHRVAALIVQDLSEDDEEGVRAADEAVGDPSLELCVLAAVGVALLLGPGAGASVEPRPQLHLHHGKSLPSSSRRRTPDEKQ